MRSREHMTLTRYCRLWDPTAERDSPPPARCRRLRARTADAQHRPPRPSPTASIESGTGRSLRRRLLPTSSSAPTAPPQSSSTNVAPRLRLRNRARPTSPPSTPPRVRPYGIPATPRSSRAALTKRYPRRAPPRAPLSHATKGISVARGHPAFRLSTTHLGLGRYGSGRDMAGPRGIKRASGLGRGGREKGRRGASVSPDRSTLKNHRKSAGHEITRVEEKSFPPEVENQLLIIEDLRLYHRENSNIRRFNLTDLPVDLGPQGPINNKLNGLLKLGPQDFKHVLIKPFLKFRRAVNDNTASGNKRGNESLVEENTGSSFDNHNAKSIMIKQVDKLSDSPDSQQFTYGCNVSAHVMLPKYKKAEVKHGCAGLLNSGNACFANSVLQYLRCIPALKAALVRYLEEGMNDELVDQASMKLTKAVCDLLGLLDHSVEAVSSDNFLQVSN
ncbi:uncharacterized protein LOC123395274 [Hordeum vulgare subsp. vulgare]|uniref:uncharacterized protein LOC123395274 n=1 Tax=Hordeum vulgare subsp. vulgare TaxID=112509 RepID=UPI001D1A5660|nr:uncharacterized protein LOC123395274 [Hordeum vulgare subsp. vulgare]